MELFLPSGDYITEKVNNIRGRFEFADSIISTGERIGLTLGALNGTVPPKIEIKFGSSTGRFNWGGTTFALDMSWFAKYKGTTDTIISGLMFIAFAWRVFVLAPGIINGASGLIGAEKSMQREMTKKEVK